MSAAEKCGKFAILPHLMTLDQPLPEELLDHAREHKPCLLKISFALAVQKVCSTVLKRLARDENCPPQEYISDFLAIMVRRLWTFPLLDERTAISVEHLAPDEMTLMTDMWEHFNECRFCHDYYYGLYEAALESQKEYAATIRNGEEVRPHARIGEIEEINANEISYNPYDPTRKPN